MKVKITTKLGDFKNGSGETSLFMGGKVCKTHIIIETVGEIDELHGWLGTLHFWDKSTIEGAMIDQYLYDIQLTLTQIMGELSCLDEQKQSYRNSFKCVTPVHIKEMEGYIKEYTDFVMNSWKLHGEDGPEVAQIDLVCKVARRIERRVAKLAQKYEVRDCILNYFNRLSDYLFVLGRKRAGE